MSTFGDDSGMAALWCMRISPMFIHGQPIETLIQNLLRAEARLTSFPVGSRRYSQFRVDAGNHLCYAYQMQGDFKKAMDIGEGIVDFAACGHVDPMYTCCAIGLLAESYLVNGEYESAKSYANTAVGHYEQIFGSDPNDGSLSAWRRRNMTIMAIACAYLGEYELAEVILVSVHVEAVRYNGPDADLSVHAHRNLDCLREAKAGLEQPLGQEGTDQKGTPNERLQELSTDRNITYLRFDLAMGLFATLDFVDFRTRAKARSGVTSGQSSFEKVTPLTAQLAAAACILQ